MTASTQIVIPYNLIAEIDYQTAELLIDNFDDVFPDAEAALKALIPQDMQNYKLGIVEKKRVPHLTIIGLSRQYEGGLTVFVKETPGTLQPVRGYVSTISPMMKEPVLQIWRCKREGCYILERGEPMECYRDQGGCGKKKTNTAFELQTEPVYNRESRFVGRESEYRDVQEIGIQDIPGSIESSTNPISLKCRVYDENCLKVKPGDIVTFNGTLKTQYDAKRNIAEAFFDVNSIEISPRNYEEVEITPEDEAKIKALAEDPELLDKLSQSLAPDVLGLDEVKAAIVLQLFAGKSLNEDGIFERGNLNILLAGEPGSAKSKLLRDAARVAQKAVLVTGTTASKVGLTASVTRVENFGKSTWVVEGGAVVLADNGIACIDEIEKADPDDLMGLHEAMEQQSCAIHKADVHMTLNARTAILAAANPRDGNFDPNDSIASQIDLQNTLMSRFDLVFIIFMPRDEATVRRLALFMRKRRRGENPEPAVDRELFRKYISYARRINPVIGLDIGAKLDEYYVEMVKLGNENQMLTITGRQFESLQRLTEAHARMRLRAEADETDVQHAINVMRYALSQYANSSGIPDIERVMGNESKSQRERLGTIKDLIGDFGGEGAPCEDVFAALERDGMPRQHVSRDIDRMKQKGEIGVLPNGNLKVLGKHGGGK